MTTCRAIALLAITTVAVAAGCGGSESSEPVATTQVSMAKSYRFDPKVIEVDAGSTVTWTNDDNFTHTVKVDGQEDHEVDRGDSVSIAFDTAGTYHYVCTLHSQDMSGEVIVR
jgi:plastocyanin